MRDLGRLDGEVEELDCTGLCAVPGLIDCHTHPAFGGDRVNEFSLRAGGASYEELHAAGGGILSTVAATRALTPEALLERVEQHAGVDARATGRRRGRGSRATGSITTRSSRRSRRCVTPAGRRPGSVRTRSRRSTPTPLRTSTSSSPRCCPRLLGSPTPLTSSSSAVRSMPPRRAGTSRRARARASHSDSTVTSSPRAGRCRWRSTSVRGASTTSRRRPKRASMRSATATSSRCCSLQARSSSTGRCRRRARWSMPAPLWRSRPTSTLGARSPTSLPLIASLACTQLHLAPEEALVAMTVNAAHVVGATDCGRLAPGMRADVTLLDAPDWRYLAYQLAGDLVSAVVRAGSTVYRR